jgi:hypothetical protein
VKSKLAAVARVPAVRNQVRINRSGEVGNRGGTVGGFFPYQFIVGAKLSVFIGFNWFFNWFFNDDMNGEFRVAAVRGRGAN